LLGRLPTESRDFAEAPAGPGLKNRPRVGRHRRPGRRTGPALSRRPGACAPAA
jgi:hypothetical protein